MLFGLIENGFFDEFCLIMGLYGFNTCFDRSKNFELIGSCNSNPSSSPIIYCICRLSSKKALLARLS